MTSHEPTPYVSSRRIGDATVTIISEGELPWAPELNAPEAKWRQAIPDADEQGRFRFGLNVALIEIGDATILIDPGLDDPSSSWQQHFAADNEGMVRTAGLQAALATLNVAPEAITHVLITHAHNDHYAGVVVERDGVLQPRFPQARHFIGRDDWEGRLDIPDPEPELAERLGLIDAHGLLETVDSGHEVAPGVTMLAAPGETPGHMVVRLESAGEVWYDLGDLYHHSCEVEHPDWISPGRDAAAMRSSRERLAPAIVADDAIVVTGHEPFPAWGRIVPSGTGYSWKKLQ